jgi:uncharacterized membrane protein (DUF485 family)
MKNASATQKVAGKLRREQMDQASLSRIESDPNYLKLVSERKSLGWTLTIITLVMYYGYIGIVAFAPSIIAIPLAGSITLGIVLGVAIILASILLTGIYVLRANAEYDELTDAIVNSNKRLGK